MACVAAIAACGGRSPVVVAPPPVASAPSAKPAPKVSDACAPAVVAKSAETISEVRVEGNVRVGHRDICNVLHTVAGGPFDKASIASDVRFLWESGFFDDVQASNAPSSTGSVVTFRVRERAMVDAVAFVGNAALSTDALQSIVSLHTKTFFDGASVKRDVRALQSAYVDAGFRSVKVEAEIAHKKGNSVDVRFTLVEGPRAVITALALHGLKVSKESDLRAALDTDGGKMNTIGGVYVASAFDRDLPKMQAKLLDLGLLASRIEPPSVKTSTDGTSVTIDLQIDEGAVFTVSSVAFQGDLAADEKTYAKIFGMKKGDVCRRSAILEGIARIEQFQSERGKPVTDVEPLTDVDAKKSTVKLTLRLVP